MRSLFTKVKLLSVALSLIVVFTFWNQYKQHELSVTPVSGEIVSIWESGGKYSSTLMYQVRFSYGVETVNANGYRYLKHQEGDIFTASCGYVPLLGCAGHAYTGHVDSFAGRHSLLLTIIQMIVLVLSGFLAYELYREKIKPSADDTKKPANNTLHNTRYNVPSGYSQKKIINSYFVKGANPLFLFCFMLDAHNSFMYNARHNQKGHTHDH